MSEIMAWFWYWGLPIWVVGGIFIILIALAISIVPETIDAKRRGYASKSARRNLRMGWTAFFSGLFLPFVILPLICYGIYKLFGPVKESLRLAYGRSKVDD